MSAIDRDQLDAWLARSRYVPNFADFDSLEAANTAMDAERAAAYAALRAAGPDALFPLLVPMLAGDVEARCAACDVMLGVDAERGRDLVLPLLHDRDDGGRNFVCKCLAERGGASAVPSLLTVLRSHPDPSLRVTAARGLGWQGGPAVIPALLAAMASDHEVDDQGYTPSHSAAMALDDVLGTQETRLRIGNVCRMPDREPNLDLLRRLAEERYQEWLADAEHNHHD